MNPSDFNIPHPTFRPHQLEALRWTLDSDSLKLLEAPTGCHRKGQPILTWFGYCKPVEQIKCGDFLVGPDSQPRRVLSLIRGTGQMYQISPRKGESIVLSENHILTLIRTNQNNPNRVKRKDCLDGEVTDVSLLEYLSWSKTRKHLFKLFRIGTDFVEYPNEPMFDPYFLGLLLGDGTMTGGRVGIVSQDEEIVEFIYMQAKRYEIRIRVENTGQGKANSYYFSKGRKGGKHAIAYHLERLGLLGHTSGNKFVPLRYKAASQEIRLRILAGLLDTDGHLSKGTCFDYISKSKQLAQDVTFLARSVGLAAYISECEKRDQKGRGGIYYRVSISGEVSCIPCKLPRKQAALRQQKKNVLRTGFSVEKLGVEDFFGFVVNKDHRYLLGDFTVTHNSGKSAIGRGVSSRRGTTVLTRTKALQDAYADLYHAHPLKGKSNYSCRHPASFGMSCDECPLAAMKGCPYSCPYLEARRLAMSVPFVATNYAYWMSSPSYRKAQTGAVFLDECHTLPDTTIEWSGITLTERQRLDWSLLPFPELRSECIDRQGKHDDPIPQAADWLAGCREILLVRWKELKSRMAKGGSKTDRKMMKACHVLGLRVAGAMNALRRDANRATGIESDWYVRSGQQGRKWAGKWIPAFVAKPLTARFHFGYYFDHAPLTVAMSATIGDFPTFARELGIQDYSSRRVPNQWPPESRPVHILDVPRMSRSASLLAFEQQADVIAEAVLGCPLDWCGFVHVTRKAEAGLLAERLARRGLQDRVWVPPLKMGTDKRAEKWEEYKQQVPNALCISWDMWMGFDGLDERIAIAAKAPFGDLSDEYEKQRSNYDRRMYLQRAAWKLEQGLGRTRRGRLEDYDAEGKRRGLVAVADASFKRFRKYLSESLREALV